jgi:Fe2+ transport system protein FeoA
MVFHKDNIRKTLSEMEISEGGVVTRVWGDYTTLRHLRELGITENLPVRRVLVDRESRKSGSIHLEIGDRRVALDDLAAGSVEVAVPRVFGMRTPEADMERWRLEYMRYSR